MTRIQALRRWLLWWPLLVLFTWGCGPLPPAVIRSQNNSSFEGWPERSAQERPTVSIVLHQNRTLNDAPEGRFYSAAGDPYPIAEAALKAAFIESGLADKVILGRADADIFAEVDVSIEADATGAWNEVSSASLEVIPAMFPERYHMRMRLLDSAGNELGEAGADEEVHAWRSLFLVLPLMPLLSAPLENPQPEEVPCDLYALSDKTGCTILLGLSRRVISELDRSGSFYVAETQAQAAPVKISEALTPTTHIELPEDTLQDYPYRDGRFAVQAGAGYGGLGDAQYLGAHGPFYAGAATLYFTEPGHDRRFGIRTDFSFADTQERTLGVERAIDVYQISAGFEFAFPGREALENWEFYFVANGGVSIREGRALTVIGATTTLSPTRETRKSGTFGGALGLKYFPTDSVFFALEVQDVVVLRDPWAINWSVSGRTGYEF